MGRRSINTTKSGKYMNPTDQARKEARKKELKKNKKQRQMVRAAVLKGKDPMQLILDLEKIDQMEYNVLQPSPLNEKVLKDKRKKLKDTLDRVLRMYNKDDPDKWAELKRLQIEYERKRAALFNYYEAVKNAQQVQVDEIPLPINALPPEFQAAFGSTPSQIPLPPQIGLLRSDMPPPQSILKKTSAYLGKEKRKEPPGIPPGPPPDLEEYAPDKVEAMEVAVTMNMSSLPPKKAIRFADDEDGTLITKNLEHEQQEISGGEKRELASENEATRNDIVEDSNPRPTTLQQKMLAMAGQDIDQFMREMEEVNKKRRADRAADLDARLQALEDKGENRETATSVMESLPSLVGLRTDSIAPSGPMPSSLGAMSSLPPLMFRPPPRGVPSLMGIRLPPGPPPGLPPRMGIRLPPGPPPGLPPRMLRPPTIPPVAPPTTKANVLTAGPQLINRPDQSGPTIQAQAQIRNLSADVTRFLPTALRVKRDGHNKPRPRPVPIHEPKVEIHHPVLKPGQTKDDAYQQFMREMEGLL